MSQASVHSEAHNQQPTIARENLLVTLLGLSIVLVIMNTMMFNFALPDVARDYHLTPVATSWIVTGYSIVFAISSITYSRLSDYIPIRILLVIGLLSLSLAAIVGFFSFNYPMLLLVRLIQASGAGAVPALSLVLISRYIPMERRGKSMAFVLSAASLGLGLGPVVGGALVEYLGWHVLFLVTAITLVLIPLLARNIPSEKPKKVAFDAIGAALSGIGTTCLLLFLTNHHWIALVSGIVAIALFALRIRMAKNPFVLPSLFANRKYLALAAVGIAAYISSFSTLFLLPQLLAHQYDLSPVMAGLVIFPGSLVAMLTSRRVGRFIDSNGNTHILRFIPYLLLLSVVLFATLEGLGYIAILFIYILLSSGFTFLSSSISNEMSKILKPSEIGSGLGLFQLLQFFSGAFGAAMSASALQWQKNFDLSQAYSNIYWGLTVIVLLSIFCASYYLRGRSAKALTTD
jgi:MFS transporter, DHA2 family, metal-tetracycline-proton antiporter